MIPGPTLSGFQWFILDIMAIPIEYLPPTAPVVGWAFALASSIANPDLRHVSSRVPGLPQTNMYNEAVYSLAADIVMNFAQDQAGRSYLREKRAELDINKFQAGVVASTADSSTSTSLLNPEFMKTLTLANLQNMKTPWGRMYLAIAQSAGPTIWGSS